MFLGSCRYPYEVVFFCFGVLGTTFHYFCSAFYYVFITCYYILFSIKLETVRVSSRRLEKVGEGRRRLEKVGESPGTF